MATPLKESEKEFQIDHLRTYTYYLVKKDRENRSSGSWDIGLRVINKKNLKNILTQATHLARSASLPSGLKIFNSSMVATLCANLIKIGPVTPKITTVTAAPFLDETAKIGRPYIPPNISASTGLHQTFTDNRHMCEDY